MRSPSAVTGSTATIEFLRGLLSTKRRMLMRHVKTIGAGDVAVLLSKKQMDFIYMNGYVNFV